MYTKKNIFVIFGFLGKEPILDYVINTKNQTLRANFFCKFFILAQKQDCNQKREKNFLPEIFVFDYEKNAYHTTFIFENYMISLFPDRN